MEPVGAEVEGKAPGAPQGGLPVSGGALSAAAPLAQDSETTQALFLSDMQILEPLKSRWTGPQGAFLAHPPALCCSANPLPHRCFRTFPANICGTCLVPGPQAHYLQVSREGEVGRAVTLSSDWSPHFLGMSCK